MSRAKWTEAEAAGAAKEADRMSATAAGYAKARTPVKDRGSQWTSMEARVGIQAATYSSEILVFRVRGWLRYPVRYPAVCADFLVRPWRSLQLRRTNVQ